MSFWSDLKDVATGDAFDTILGAVMTFEGYGFLSGVLDLSTVEPKLVEQAMNAAAASGKQVLEGRSVDVALAWKGQLADRTRTMIEVGGSAYVASALAAVQTYLGPEIAGQLRALWTVRDAVAQVDTGGYLRAALAACSNGGIRYCRPDSLALAANAVTGQILYDPSGWDPETGAPPNASAGGFGTGGGDEIPTRFSAEELLGLAAEARRRGLPPEVATSLRSAAARRAAGVPVGKIDMRRIGRGDGKKKLRAPRISGPTTAVDLGDVAAGGADGDGLFGYAILAAILSSPWWAPVMVGAIRRRV